MKIPKLTFIKFDSWTDSSTSISNDAFSINNQFELIYLTLGNVTTIQLSGQSFEEKIEWIIHLLPNLRHCILYSIKFPRLGEILIKQFDVLHFSTFVLLMKQNYIHFSEVEHISFWIETDQMDEKSIEKFIMKILNNFYHLKILIIYFYSRTSSSNSNSLNNLFRDLNINQITNNYLVKIQKDILYLQINVETSDLNPSVMCTSKSKLIDDRLILIKLSKKVILERTKELPFGPCRCPLFVP
jgi:hypothetical protein